MIAEYDAFLATKRVAFAPVGFDPVSLSPHHKPFQRACVRRACVMGRSAMFADCGLGKSLMILDWALQVYFKTGRPVLVLCPLAVTRQFEREAAKFGIAGVRACRDRSEMGDAAIVVTNYEKLHHFDPADFAGIALDESSILKAYEGSTRKAITAFASSISYRLAATATPAPNDLIELTNHAEFLGVMTGKEIIACFFTQDGNTTQKYRLKGHAREAFWHWMATWTTALRKPSDLGFSDDGYALPDLSVIDHVTESPVLPGHLFVTEAQTLSERRQARRASLPDRARIAADLAMAEPDEPWVIWCDLNDEAEALTALVPGAVECRGTDSPEEKEAKFAAFADGRIRVLVTKSRIAGFGLNWQHCRRTCFVGVSDSFEAMYQAIRRFWRFGQDRPVCVHLIASDAEGSVLANIRRKEKDADAMYAELTAHMAAAVRQTDRDVSPYEPTVPMRLPHWLRSEVAA